MSYDTRPATCYQCGGLVPDGPRFGAEATCDACRRTVGQPDPWVMVYGTPAPFKFYQDGQWFICAWHPGFDKLHPANRDASHGLCPDCSGRLGAES